MWITKDDGDFDEALGGDLRARCVRIADAAGGNARHRLQIGKNWDDPQLDLEIEYFTPRLWARDDGFSLVFEKHAHAFVVGFDSAGATFRAAGSAPRPVADIQPAIQDLLSMFGSRLRWESPDGSLVVDYERQEFSGTIAIAPKISDAATGHVWLDLTGMMWNGPPRPNCDGTVDFRIGTVMDNQETALSIRPASGDFCIDSGTYYRPLSELEEQFYRAAELSKGVKTAAVREPSPEPRKRMARWLRISLWTLAAPFVAFALLLVGAFFHGMFSSL